MDFDLTEEQRAWQRAVHDFVAKEVEPKAHEVDETSEFNWTAARKGAALAPERLRFWSTHLTPFSEDRIRLGDIRICDLGDLPVNNQAQDFKLIHQKVQAVEQNPRQVLKRLISVAADAGYELKTGVECEYFLITPDGQAISDAAEKSSAWYLANKDRVARTIVIVVGHSIRDHPQLAVPLGRLLNPRLVDFPTDALLIPVPLHPRRLREQRPRWWR